MAAMLAVTSTGFRYRNDDGDETGATWVYALNIDGDLDVDTVYRMRAELTETGGAASNNVELQWEYNLNSTGWNSVTTSAAPIQAVSSAETSWTITDGDDTTQQLGGGGSYEADNDAYTEDGLGGGAVLDWDIGYLVESELCFQIPAAQVADNDTIELRCTAVGKPNTYTTIATISVNEAGGTTYFQDVGGSITPTGDPSLEAQKAVAGAITPIGDPSVEVQKQVAGALTPTGSVSRETAISTDGSITPTGALAASKIAFQSAAGSITPTGALSVEVQKAVAGSITPTGSVSRETAISTDGSLTPTGALAASKIAFQSAAGSITPTGALSVEVQKAAAGSITPTGALTVEVQKAVAGEITPTGALSVEVQKAVAGSITPTGALAASKIAFQSAAGSITPTGALLIRVEKTLAGTLTPTGTLARSIGKTFAGVITPTGALSTVYTEGQPPVTGAGSPRGDSSFTRHQGPVSYKKPANKKVTYKNPADKKVTYSR